MKVVAERGAVGATLRDFAGQAGVTDAAIYRHFASREELLNRVFRVCASALYDYLDSRRFTVPAEEEIGELAAAFFDFSLDHPEEYAFIVAVHQQQLLCIDTDVERLPKDLIVESVQRLQEHHGGAKLPASLVTGAILGTVMGVTLFRQFGQTAARADECREYLRRTAAALAFSACGEQASR